MARKHRATQMQRQQKRLEKNKKQFKQDKQEAKNLKGKSTDLNDFPGLWSFLKDPFPRKRFCEDTIPYVKMYPSGILHLGGGYYNKAIAFEDASYQLLDKDDQRRMFNRYAALLNTFHIGDFLDIQLCFTNQHGRSRDLIKAISIPYKHDGHDAIRKEFRGILRSQLARGNNDLKKTKQLIFTVKADSLKEATGKLERVEIDVLNHFRKMEVQAEGLLGDERIKYIHDFLNPEREINFAFSRAKKNTDTRSLVVPNEFNFISRDVFKFGDYIGTVNMLNIEASEMSDHMLAEILDVDDNINVSFQIRPISQQDAVKYIKRKNTDVNAAKIDEQKKAIMAGYDMDIIPPDLSMYSKDIENQLIDVQENDEKMFFVTILIMNFAKNMYKLSQSTERIKAIVSKYNCSLSSLSYRQEQGLVSCLPIGKNEIENRRRLTSSSLAVFIPFKAQELLINSPTSLYYGLNALSHNLIMADRKALTNPNGLILGIPGSGKSFAAKREMTNVILLTDDDVVICDPEGEYSPLVEAFNGEVVMISAKSKNYINPFDINANYGDGDNPLKDKANFIISLIDLVVGGEGLTAAERSVLDRCIIRVYDKYFSDPKPENLPIWEDLYNMLRTQEEELGKKLSIDMEIYVHGSLNVFNHYTNVDLDKQLISFNIKELGSQLKKIGMFVLQDQVWNKVSRNRDMKKPTWYYIDEFHLLLKEKQTADYSAEIWKRFRKWGGIPTGITQNVKDLLGSSSIQNILDNTDFVLLLNQAPLDLEILAENMKISPYQQDYVDDAESGCGLIKYGKLMLPFNDKFPKDTMLYKKMTTRPEEVEAIAKKEN